MPLIYPTGYVRRADAIKDFIRNTHKPFLGQQNAEIKGSGKGVQVRLVKAYEQVTGTPHEPHFQNLGTCVGEGGVLAVDFLSAVEIVAGEREEWRGKFSTEFSYAISRVEVGKRAIRNGDGSTGVWMAKGLMQYGVLLRAKYGDFDLTGRRDDLAKRWGDMGVPDDLELIGRERVVETAALCESAEQAAESIANGSPIFLCCNRLRSLQTDKDGFSKFSKRSGHCTMLGGVDTKSDRWGFEEFNSWGDCYRGPKHKLGTAKGATWTDWDEVDRCLQQGDSFAISSFVGFPRRKLDYVIL